MFGCPSELCLFCAFLPSKYEFGAPRIILFHPRPVPLFHIVGSCFQARQLPASSGLSQLCISHRAHPTLHFFSHSLPAPVASVLYVANTNILYVAQ